MLTIQRLKNSRRLNFSGRMISIKIVKKKENGLLITKKHSRFHIRALYIDIHVRCAWARCVSLILSFSAKIILVTL